jgi:hypothetical protein
MRPLGFIEFPKSLILRISVIKFVITKICLLSFEKTRLPDVTFNLARFKVMARNLQYMGV